MFKKPFNYTAGEIRICKTCNEEFTTFKPLWTCKKCACKKGKVSRWKRIDEGKITYKATYPYVNHKKEYGIRFKKLQSILNKMKIRSQWQEYLKQRLDEVMNDEVLMLWINDRRDRETLDSKKIKTKSQTKKDFPDTRGHHEY